MQVGEKVRVLTIEGAYDYGGRVFTIVDVRHYDKPYYLLSGLKGNEFDESRLEPQPECRE